MWLEIATRLPRRHTLPGKLLHWHQNGWYLHPHDHQRCHFAQNGYQKAGSFHFFQVQKSKNPGRQQPELTVRDLLQACHLYRQMEIILNYLFPRPSRKHIHSGNGQLKKQRAKGLALPNWCQIQWNTHRQIGQE